MILFLPLYLLYSIVLYSRVYCCIIWYHTLGTTLECYLECIVHTIKPSILWCGIPDVTISLVDISVRWLQYLVSKMEFTVLNSPKGFWRSLPEISLFLATPCIEGFYSLIYSRFTFLIHDKIRDVAPIILRGAISIFCLLCTHELGG